MFHLHRFERYELLPFGYYFAGLHVHRDDAARHRGQDRPITGGTVPRPTRFIQNVAARKAISKGEDVSSWFIGVNFIERYDIGIAAIVGNASFGMRRRV